MIFADVERELLEAGRLSSMFPGGGLSNCGLSPGPVLGSKGSIY